MKRLAATDAESLERIVGHVHDAWFDVDRIERDGDIVTIPIALRGIRVKKRFLPEFQRPPDSFESVLTIRGVREFEIDDPAQVGTYDINELEYAAPQLRLTTGQELVATFEVSELDVEAQLQMNSYEWRAPGATALVAPVRAAEPVIGEYRRAHTPSGRAGMPAHVTVLAPFIHASRLDSFDRHTLSDTIGRFRGFDLRLSSFGVFDDIACLWLRPQPAAPFSEITDALRDVYVEVEYPTDHVPHVTIGSRLSEKKLEEIKSELAPRLPIRGRVDRVVLYERGADGRWADRYRFRLKA